MSQNTRPSHRLCGSKVKLHWGKLHQKEFDKMNEIIVEEAMLTYPQFGKPFIIHSDSSEKHIGSILSQDNKPIAFFSKKMTPTQQRYPVTEQELLASVETLKYLKYMLYGQQVHIYTDHKNLTYPTVPPLMFKTAFCIND
jgi:hypothetical protein